MEIIKKGVAEVSAREEKMVKMRSITGEHCFGGDEIPETIRRRKTPRLILCSFKERRNYY